jgi:hypothetical protein
VANVEAEAFPAKHIRELLRLPANIDAIRDTLHRWNRDEA